MKPYLIRLWSIVLLGSACGVTNPGESGGTRVLLTDAPFPFDIVQSVNIHIVSVSASADTDTTVADQRWVTVAEPNQRFNLLELQKGATAIVAEGTLPASQFRAVQLVIDTDKSDHRTLVAGRLCGPGSKVR